jgi:hypothetical protein
LRRGPICDERDRLLEGATSNVFAVRGGRLTTRAVAGLLAAARALVIDAAARLDLPCDETVTAADAAGAGEVFLCGSVKEIVPVTAVDGVPVAAPGPVTRRLWKPTAEVRTLGRPGTGTPASRSRCSRCGRCRGRCGSGSGAVLAALGRGASRARWSHRAEVDVLVRDGDQVVLVITRSAQTSTCLPWRETPRPGARSRRRWSRG